MVQPLGLVDAAEEKMATHSIFLAGKFRGQRSLVGYSPWGCKELDMIEWLSMHLSYTEKDINIVKQFPRITFESW